MSTFQFDLILRDLGAVGINGGESFQERVRAPEIVLLTNQFHDSFDWLGTFAAVYPDPTNRNWVSEDDSTWGRQRITKWMICLEIVILFIYLFTYLVTFLALLVDCRVTVLQKEKLLVCIKRRLSLILPPKYVWKADVSSASIFHWQFSKFFKVVKEP